MVALFASLIFSITGLVFTYENVYFTGGMLENYFVALYMIGITMTTVGYGDFYPISRAGRIVIILGVLSALWIIPSLIASVLEPWRHYRANRTYSGSGHAVIFSRSENVQTIIEQFYRTKKTVAENVLLMTPSSESGELKSFLRSEFLRLRVSHFEGDWSSPKTVSRAAPNKAHFNILVQSKFADDPETADANMIAGALAVLRTSKSVPLFMQLNSASRQYAFDHNRDNILCMNDLRRGLLVLNCTAPGILSVLSNLIISKPGKPKRHKKSWLAPYKNGLYAKFETDIPLDCVAGHSWSNVCIALHALFSITFLSIWNEQQGLLLFPRMHIISEGDVGQFVHDMGRKSIITKLSSEPFQKYLIMLKARAHIDDIDHMKALSLADMLDTEDEHLVKQFDLYQRSNLNDILAVSRSSRYSHEDTMISSENKSPGSRRKASFEASSTTKDGQGLSQGLSSPKSDKISRLETSRGSMRSAKSGKSARSAKSGKGSVTNSPQFGDHQVHPSDPSLHSRRASLAEGRESGVSRSSIAAADPFVQNLDDAEKMISEDELEPVEIGATWDRTVAKRTSLEGKLSKHIVVCGKADEMTTSIARRLYKRSPEQQDIVLLISRATKAAPKVLDQITALANTDRIYVLIGQAVNPVDLRRAAATTARVCLVLPEAEHLADESVQAAQDSNMLITYHLLRQTDVFPIIELMNPENEQLMAIVEDESNAAAQASTNASLSAAKLGTASGNIFRRSLFDNILAQAVFKRHLIPLFGQLADSKISHLALKRIWDDIKSETEPHSNVLFGQVFSFVEERKGCLAIAIYRKRSDAQDEWVARHLSKANKKHARFPLDAGRAFRASKSKQKLIPQSIANTDSKRDENDDKSSTNGSSTHQHSKDGDTTCPTDDERSRKSSIDSSTHSAGSARSAKERLAEKLKQKLREQRRIHKRKKKEKADGDLRIAINAPANDTVMLRSDIIFVIEYDREKNDESRVHSAADSLNTSEEW